MLTSSLQRTPQKQPRYTADGVHAIVLSAVSALLMML